MVHECNIDIVPRDLDVITLTPNATAYGRSGRSPCLPRQASVLRPWDVEGGRMPREKGAHRAMCQKVLFFLQMSSTTRTKSPLNLKITRKLSAPHLAWSKTYLSDSYSPRFNSLTHNFMDPPLSRWLGDIVAHLLGLILSPAFNRVR